MFDIFISIIGIYIFIAVGYIAKATFKEQINERTVTLLSIYFLQIFLTFWGLLKRPIDMTLIVAPMVYLSIILSALVITYLFSRKLFSDKKERSIAMVAALIGNTANLGIPLNIAIFGEDSVAYTTIINLVNIFFLYTFGVYTYSRGNFDIKSSLKNIVKLPILWAAAIAIALNLSGYHPSQTVEKTLMMGAYASITMQLLLFGIYLYDVKLREMNRTLIVWVSGVKFILLPLMTFVLLSFIQLDNTIKGILFLELMMPLAIANVNLTSLYECRPRDMTALVLITSALFLILIFGGVEIIHNFL